MPSLLIALLALLSIVSLASVLVLTFWTLKRSERQSASSQQSAALTTSATSAMTQVMLEQMTASQAKTLGSIVALQRESTSSMLSLVEQTQKQLADAITLLATKEPMAYSQVRQTQVAIGDVEDGGEPYAAVDDQATAEAKAAAEAEYIREQQEIQDYLAQQGINVQEM